MLKKLEKISRALKDLTFEVRDLKNSNQITNQDENIVGLPNLPLKSLNEMDDMDIYLRTANDTSNFVCFCIIIIISHRF